MKVLIKIGYSHFLLPNEKGVQAVLKTMSEALHCTDRSYLSSDPSIEVDPDPMEVSIKYVTGKIKVRLRSDRNESTEETQLRLIAPTAIIPPQQD